MPVPAEGGDGRLWPVEDHPRRRSVHPVVHRHRPHERDALLLQDPCREQRWRRPHVGRGVRHAVAHRRHDPPRVELVDGCAGAGYGYADAGLHAGYPHLHGRRRQQRDAGDGDGDAEQGGRDADDHAGRREHHRGRSPGGPGGRAQPHRGEGDRRHERRRLYRHGDACRERAGRADGPHGDDGRGRRGHGDAVVDGADRRRGRPAGTSTSRGRGRAPMAPGRPSPAAVRPPRRTSSPASPTARPTPSGSAP